MRRHPWILLCSAGAAVLFSCALALRTLPQADPAGTAAPEPTATCGPASIADGSVTRLSVVTAESQYIFKCSEDARISVNGQKADRDVFLTLLDQILTMPVVTIPPFVPADEAAVTLTLVTDSTQYTAAFYRDGDEESPYISIISGGTDAPCYQRTDRWRLGTMLLACEGTRIQDEQGAETPMGND